jgi:predicted SAM-dependent methyltransferase
MSLIHRLVSRYVSLDAADHLVGFFSEIRVAIVHAVGRAKAHKYRGACGLKLNVGCGEEPKAGFLNLDYQPTADIRLDLRRELPFDSASCALVFSEHFLEHLAYPEGADAFLSEASRVLAPGGELKLSVPDTEWPLRDYCRQASDWVDACERLSWHTDECTTFMEHLNYHFRQRWSGTADVDFSCHRFAYDFETLTKALERASFVDIALRPFEPGLDSSSREIGSLFVLAQKS